MSERPGKVTPLIITCAITGDNHQKGKDEYSKLPVTLKDQAQHSFDAYNAGASIVHIHRRSAANTAITSSDPREYLEVNKAIRMKCPDVIINNTNGGSKKRREDGSLTPPTIISILARPEIASFDAASMTVKQAKFSPAMAGKDEGTVLTAEEAEEVLNEMEKYGCKPEFMCYGIDDYRYITQIINAGLLNVKKPYWLQLLFSGSTMLSRIEDVNTAIGSLPERSMLTVIADGETQWGVLAAAIALGAHVRVGMEDSIFLNNGEKAVSNARLVEKAVRIAKELGRPIATPIQAREILGIGDPRLYE